MKRFDEVVAPILAELTHNSKRLKPPLSMKKKTTTHTYNIYSLAKRITFMRY